MKHLRKINESDSMSEFVNHCFIDLLDLNHKSNKSNYPIRFDNMGYNSKRDSIIGAFRLQGDIPDISGGKIEDVNNSLDEMKSIIGLIEEGIDKVRTKYDMDYQLNLYQQKYGTIDQVVAEVKPDSETRPPVIKENMTAKQMKNLEYSLKMYNANLSKWKYMIDYCDRKGFVFIILTEKHIQRR